MAAPFRLYNTLSRSVERFEPIEPGKIRLYVCGMTVYDEAHIGHARAFVVFDVIYRYLQSRGWDVNFVRNFTDIDDKIIVRAKEKGEDWLELADRYIAAWTRDAKCLKLKPPTSEPRVTHHIEEIVALITSLVEKGHAYEAEGSVFFAVRSDEAYGKLSGQKIDELRSADPEGGKRDPADFALWKGQKSGEPAWESPWGPGRPGWHIECSAMAQTCLGDTIDIHGGGLDLIWPHHENEIAQSECGTGKDYVRYWMHNGMLTMASGQKMGKSLGNVINICDLVKQFPSEALRLYYLQNHYRSPLPWSDQALPEALTMLARLYEAREVAEGMGGQESADDVAQALGDDAQKVLSLGRSMIDRFHGVMDDDFNTAAALGHLFELARAINRFSGHKKANKRGGPIVAPALQAMAAMAPVFGILEDTPTEFQEQVKDKRLPAMGLSRDEVEGLIAQRTTARVEKDWARADTLRDELAARHIVIMDRPHGTDWRIATG
jgi:cysteinyl-tRNA synthetase